MCIIYSSSNLTKTQAVLRVYFNSDIFSQMNTIPIADELYLLGKRLFLLAYNINCFKVLIKFFFQRPWVAYLVFAWELVL